MTGGNNYVLVGKGEEANVYRPCDLFDNRESFSEYSREPVSGNMLCV